MDENDEFEISEKDEKQRLTQTPNFAAFPKNSQKFLFLFFDQKCFKLSMKNYFLASFASFIRLIAN